MAQDGRQIAALEDPSRRYRWGLLALLVLLVLVFLTSACLGRFSVGLPDLLEVMWTDLCNEFRVLLGQAPLTSGVDNSIEVLLLEVRLPRVFVCALVGAALSIAGASYQGLFQNPMCSQDVLGASSGAAFGAALGLLLGFSAGMVSTLAFVFGIAAVALSIAVSRASRGNMILALILSGMVVSALFSSGTSAIKLVADTEEVLPAITYWLMGSLASIRRKDILVTLVLVVLASLPIFLLRWRINLLATGEEEAKSMGINTTLLRVIIIGCATFLTATCVSISGLIGWVGLVIPHFCRLIFGNDYRRIIPATALMGASFLLVVDDLARLLTTAEIPIGILTAFVGAPIFLILIKRGGASRGAKCF